MIRAADTGVIGWQPACFRVGHARFFLAARRAYCACAFVIFRSGGLGPTAGKKQNEAKSYSSVAGT
jgi:hypothetical protein